MLMSSLTSKYKQFFVFLLEMNYIKEQKGKNLEFMGL